MNAEEYADKHAKIVAEAANLRAAIDTYNANINSLYDSTRRARKVLCDQLRKLQATGASLPAWRLGESPERFLFGDPGVVSMSFAIAMMPTVEMQIPVDGGSFVD